MSGLTKSARERSAIALRGQIVGLFRSGKKIKDICDVTGVNRQTARKWICGYQESGDLSSARRSGGPRATTAAQDAAILEMNEQQPMDNEMSIWRQLEIGVHPRTVRNRLHEAGRHHRIPASKEELSERNIQERLSFCDQHRDLDFDYWKNVRLPRRVALLAS